VMCVGTCSLVGVGRAGHDDVQWGILVELG
jgi:hypothetical protein